MPAKISFSIRSLYEQVEGVAMGSPLGPLMANAFMCNIEEQLETENKMPAFYKRYVDDTPSAIPDFETANDSHASIDFTLSSNCNFLTLLIKNLPNIFSQYFCYASEVHAYNTRYASKDNFYKARVCTVFSQLNAPGVYFKLSQLYPAFIRGRRLLRILQTFVGLLLANLFFSIKLKLIT